MTVDGDRGNFEFTYFCRSNTFGLRCILTSNLVVVWQNGQHPEHCRLEQSCRWTFDKFARLFAVTEPWWKRVLQLRTILFWMWQTLESGRTLSRRNLTTYTGGQRKFTGNHNRMPKWSCKLSDRSHERNIQTEFYNTHLINAISDISPLKHYPSLHFYELLMRACDMISSCIVATSASSDYTCAYHQVSQ